MSKKKTCASCSHFLYFPPVVQKELDEDPFHCTKDKWRGEQDPAVFLKKIKCKKWRVRTKAYNDYFKKEELVRQTKPKLVRTKLIRRK